jgi:hypothetical protein
VAVFENDGLENRLPIEAWDDDGNPLVVEGEKLRRAADFRNFEAVIVHDYDSQEVVSMIPAGGWRVEYEDDSSEPLVGWGVTTAGNVVPLETDASGDVQISDGEHSNVARIYHPDADDPKARLKDVGAVTPQETSTRPLRGGRTFKGARVVRGGQ